MGRESYSASFPEYFDDYAAEIEAKGYFADLIINIGHDRVRPTIYDPVRFAQECQDAFASGTPYFAASCMIIVPSVTRPYIEAAVTALAARGFEDLLDGHKDPND